VEALRLVRQKLPTYLVVGPFAIVLAFPFYWMLVTMFKTDTDLYNKDHVPYVYNPLRWEFWDSATTKHVSSIFDQTNYPTWLANTAIVGGAVPKEYIPGVQKGLESVKDSGLLAGFPLIDFKATLTDGKFHDVDSSVLAFEIAARAAFRELKEKGAPKLLEPIMKVEVLVPDEYLGDVIGDLNSRRGQIQGTDQRGNAQVVTAFVPLANMFGYIGNLRGMSQGRAQFTMQYDHYEPVPQHVADEVIKKYA